MHDKLIQHIRSRRPALDVRGRWLHIANPKTASVSIGARLDHQQATYTRGFRNWSRIWAQVTVPALLKDRVIMFTFVRNSWDKLVSAVCFLQKRHVIDPDMSFKHFVMDRLLVEGFDINRHLRPQTPTFLYRGEMIPGMFIGRFENLRHDWGQLARKLRVSQRLPWMNRTQHAHYTTYYDDELVEVVRNLYREEIEALGYEFGQETT